MKSLLYKTPVKSACLGAMMLLSLTACTDDHFDIMPATDTACNTLWQNIQSRPELDSLQMILSRTKVIRKTTENSGNVMYYSQLLNTPQSYTLWAPLNGKYQQHTAKYYLDLLEQAEAIRNAEGAGTAEAIEANEIHERVGTQFIKNHLARFNYESNSGEQKVRMLNSKVCYYDMGANKFNGVNINAGYGRIVSSNGVMYVLDSSSPFAYNVYDYIEANQETLSKVNAILRDPEVEKEEFNEYLSTPGATDENGNVHYVDSVYTKTNTILDYAGAAIQNEDSLYIAVIPSDNAWDKAYDEVSQLYRYNKKYKYEWLKDKNQMGKTYPDGTKNLDADSLQNYNTNAALIRSMFFSPGDFDYEVNRSDSAKVIDYVLYHDSIESTNGVIYHNPKTGNNGSNPLFNNQKPVKASNGYVFAVGDYALHPSYSFQSREEVDLRYTTYVLSVSGGTATSILLQEGTNWNKEDVKGQVTDNRYCFFKSSGSTMEVYIRLDGIASGKYKISAEILPNRICEDNIVTVEGEEGEEVYKPQNTRFQAMLKYDDGTNVPSPSQTDVIEVDENEIKTYVLWDEVEFKRSYVNLPAGVDSFPYLVLRMPNKLLSKDNVNGLSVSRIIIEPIHE